MSINIGFLHKYRTELSIKYINYIGSPVPTSYSKDIKPFKLEVNKHWYKNIVHLSGLLKSFVASISLIAYCYYVFCGIAR